MQYITNWTQPSFNSYLSPVFISQNPTPTAVTNVGRVRLVMIQIPDNVILEGVYVYNDATVAGNLRVGLYRSASGVDTPVGGVLVATSDDTAMAGANQSQYIPFNTNPLIEKGIYFVCCEYSDATATYGKLTTTGVALLDGTAITYYDRGGGYGAFTDPCPAVTASSVAPWMILKVA